MSNLWILDCRGVPQRETNVITWAQWYQSADRHIACDTVGKSEVSTVFLGIEHPPYKGGRPALWETMVFRGTEESSVMPGRKFRREREQYRWHTRDEAEAGHAEVCRRLHAELQRVAEN